jgi:predicted dehydrogenase
MNTLGIGLIGCGIWGSVHARTYAASPLVKLVAVCDQNRDRAQQFKEKYGFTSFTSDLKEILSNPDISAVSITTPDHTHTPILLEVMEAGKHVLVEKPLAMTVEECEKILAVRDKTGVKLMVDFHNRWNIPFLQVKQMIESGELGDLMMMNVKLNDTIYVPTKMLSWAGRSSPVHFLGSHLVDLIRCLSGAEIQRVYSVSRSVVLKNKGIETPDFYQSILELSDGSTAYVENCWIVAENAPNIFDFKGEFIGSKGSTYVNVSDHRMIEKYTEEGSSYPDVTGIVDIHGKPAGHCTAPIEHFIHCVVHDTEPAVTGEDGLKATRVVQAMEQSARTGQPVNIIV